MPIQQPPLSEAERIALAQRAQPQMVPGAGAINRVVQGQGLPQIPMTVGPGGMMMVAPPPVAPPVPDRMSDALNQANRAPQGGPGYVPIEQRNANQAGWIQPQGKPEELANAHTLPPSRQDPALARTEDQTVGYQQPQGDGAPVAPQTWGGPVQIRPAHFEPNARQTQIQEGVQYSDQTKKGLDDAAKHQREAVKMQGEAEQDRVSREGRVADMYAGQMQADMASEDIRNTVKNSRISLEKEKLEQLVDGVRNYKEDPFRWMGKTTGAKVATGIMVSLTLGLDGFLKGFRGQSVGALEHLNRIIDQDINSQRAEHTAKVQGVEQQKGILALTRQQFADEDAQTLAKRIMAKEALGQKILSLSSSTNDKLARARAEALYGQNEKELALLRKSFEENASARVVRSMSETWKPDQVIGGGGPPPGGATFDTDAASLVDMGDGTMRVADSKEAAQKIKDRKAFEGNIMSLQQEALDVMKKYGTGALVPGTTGYQQLQKIKERAIPLQSQATQQGVVREFERDPTLSGLGLNFGLKTGLAAKVGIGQSPQQMIENAMKNTPQGSQEMMKQHLTGPVVRQQYVPSRDGKKVQQQYQFVAPGGPLQVPQGPQQTQTPQGFRQ